MFSSLTEPDFPGLATALKGRMLVPGDDGWDAARQAWNLAVDQHPAAVVFAEDPEDMVATVRFARDNAFRVTVQGTGHGANTLGDLTDTILIKTVRMAGIQIDREKRIARVEGGALWGDIVMEAGEAGLAALHGSSVDVAAIGYTLGGGIGWLAREYGLASNRVTAIDVVTAEGERKRVDAETDPDLFWALRGGGGSFALVVAIEFELFPVTEVYAGMVGWIGERGPEILDAWRAWTKDLPEGMTSSFRWLQLPPLPEVPEPLRGRPTVAITAAYIGPESEAIELLEPLRSIPGATLDMFGTMPATELRRLNGDPEHPMPALGDHRLLVELDDRTAAGLCEVMDPAQKMPLIFTEIRHLGGALGRVPEGAGVLGKVEGEYLLLSMGAVMDPAMTPAIRGALDRVLAQTGGVSCSGYLNFADTEIDPASAFTPGDWKRLREIKTRVDSWNTIRSNHPIEPN